jgi:hypothetical protein
MDQTMVKEHDEQRIKERGGIINLYSGKKYSFV